MLCNYISNLKGFALKSNVSGLTRTLLHYITQHTHCDLCRPRWASQVTPSICLQESFHSILLCNYVYVLLRIVVVKEMFLVNLTGVLSDCGGLALAILRHGDHADVVVDAGFQSVDSVMASCWQNRVFEDGYGLTGCHHRDPVTGDGRGVEWRPAETDSGVAHVLEGEVRQLWNF